MTHRVHELFPTYTLWSEYVKEYMPLVLVDERPMKLILNDANGSIVALWDNTKDVGYVYKSNTN